MNTAALFIMLDTKIGYYVADKNIAMPEGYTLISCDSISYEDYKNYINEDHMPIKGRYITIKRANEQFQITYDGAVLIQGLTKPVVTYRIATE